MSSRERFEELYGLNKSFNAFYGTLAGALGLSKSEFAVFYTIKAYGEGCAQRDVCEYCMLSKQTVSSGIEGMVEKGYIRLKPGKGRIQEIYLTGRGKAIMENKLSLVENAENKAYGKLSKADQEKLNELLGRFLDALHGN